MAKARRATISTALPRLRASTTCGSRLAPSARIPARACNFDREAKGLGPNRSSRGAPWLDGAISAQGACMRKKIVSALALATATGFAHPASAGDGDESQGEKAKADARSYLAPAALIAAGVAAAAMLAGRSGGGAPNGNTAGGSASSAGNPGPRSLSYASAADFDTAEYNAQTGLAWVKADSLYYNGHYRWFTSDAPSPAAGTGIGVKIAVADTGINPREAATGSAIAIDVAASYDYIANRSGAGADDFGHGTHVAGIIAAPKNGAGMHGLAYNATLVNFRVGNATGAITASDAQLGDMIGRAANAGAMIINNSWALSASPITSYTTQDLLSSMPRMIDASRAYVAAGGVVVFATGNDASAQPAMQAGLPYRVSGIEPGWLAVVALDNTGRIASYSNRCGVAATWCLAAPGGSADIGIVSMSNNGGYAAMYGTSMAAPHASAALAALKSMFVNLSYLQIRDRLLYTANRSGSYADADTYGQGLIDLDAASSPVGGISLPTGASANGATAPLSGSAIVMQAGAAQALRLQPYVLVVDNYQRALFWVPARTFVQETTPQLLERQWASLRSGPLASRVETLGRGLRVSYSAGLNNALSLDLGSYRLGFSQGAGGEALLGTQLELASLPRLAAPGVESVALGYARNVGAIRFGFVGTLPTSSATEARTLESSSLGSRSAFAAVAQLADGSTTYGLTFAVAEHFERPIGLAASGAFDLGQSSAVSSGAFVRHALRATLLEGSLEVAQHRSDGNGMLSAPQFAVRSASVGASTALGARTTFSASFKRESAAGQAAQLQLPSTISASGDIGRVAYALPYDDLVGRTALTLRLDHEFNRHVALRAGFTHERYGFATSVTGVAAVLEIAN